MKTSTSRSGLAVYVLLPLIFTLSFSSALLIQGCAPAAEGPDYVVWATDQNANDLYILNPDGEVVEILDEAALGGAQRPHMIWGTPPDPFVYSANTESENMTVLDARNNSVVAVVEQVGKAPHAVQPNPSRPDHIYVSNIGPQGVDEDGHPDRGETIAEILRHGDEDGNYTWELNRFLDLKADPMLDDDEQFPSRRPVCAGFTPDGRYMMMTLFNGGLAVIDLDEWRVDRAWGKDEIGEHGCGFAESPGRDEIYVTAGDMHMSWLYVFEFTGDGPELVATHNLSETGQDAHGAWVDTERDELWVVHRVSSNATIHPLDAIREEGHTYEEMEFIGDTPDLIMMPAASDRAFITLRGPNPAPTIPHDIVGVRPGISIIDVAERELINVIHLGDPEYGDFHGLYIPEGI